MKPTSVAFKKKISSLKNKKEREKITLLALENALNFLPCPD